ncbi:hypothetical protein GQ457_06G009680 [Hibiscus cannabinus]
MQSTYAYHFENVERDSRFQYDHTLDENNKLQHIFWSPAYCFDLYQEYADAVAFDTMYKVNYIPCLSGFLLELKIME